MSPFAFIALLRKRRQLREAEAFLAQVRDQIHSGRIVERQLEQKVARLQAEMFGLENPADIVRRAGVC